MKTYFLTIASILLLLVFACKKEPEVTYPIKVEITDTTKALLGFFFYEHSSAQDIGNGNVKIINTNIELKQIDENFRELNFEKGTLLCIGYYGGLINESGVSGKMFQTDLNEYALDIDITESDLTSFGWSLYVIG
ncbi:MAG: hypothetical protein WBH98_01200 [Bacteroidales bacterium]